MKRASLEEVFRALNNAKVRYLVAGGMAVIAHGYPRVTFDLDLIIQLRPDNIVRGLDALATIGYLPRVPVTSAQFADKGLRTSWIREKGMRVLQLHSETHVETPIDVFVEEPFDFDAWYDNSPEEEIATGVTFRFVAVEPLLEMKLSANRDKDRDDIVHLRMIMEEMHGKE